MNGKEKETITDEELDEILEKEKNIRARHSYTMTMMDDTIAKDGFKDNIDLTKTLVEDVTLRQFEIISVKTQQNADMGILYRGVRFDVYAKDKDGTAIDIEIQTYINDHNLVDRSALYYSELLVLQSGKGKKEIRYPTWPILIFLVAEKSNYESLKQFDESTEKRPGIILHHPYYGKGEIYFVYLRDTDSKTPIGDLARDLMCNDIMEIHNESIRSVLNSYHSKMEETGMASTKKSRELAKALKQVPYDVGKEHGIKIGKAEGKAEGLAEGKAEGLAEGKAEGKAEGLAEGKAEGKAEGAEEAKRNIARRLISMGMDNEVIHQSTELTMETIEEIRKQVM